MKNKLGLSVRTKKGFFGQKVGGRTQYKDQKLTNFTKTKKMDISGQKKQAGAELKKKKKRIFWVQNLEKI